MYIERVINKLQNYSASTVRRIISWVACLALILSSSPALPAAFESINSSRIQYIHKAPFRNLPNLDAARRMTPAVPKMLSDVRITKPSKQKSNGVIDLISSFLSPSWGGIGASSAIANLIVGSQRTDAKKISAKPVAAAAKSVKPISAATMQQIDDWPMALLEPKNRVGTGGEDLLSRNFNWGLPLVSLPGRAGLDLNLGLAYNSLVWTQSGGNIYFDGDDGFPSPGFHLGLPELGESFFDSKTGVAAYLVTMPSGSRYEFRKNTALGTNVYEEQTGTNMLLTITHGPSGYLTNTWKILTPDGTTYTFKVKTSIPRCTQIKDRNGNYISISYTINDRIDTITDTLGRVVKFNNDPNTNLLTSITQIWGAGTENQVTHIYAEFFYSNVTISAAFLTLNMIGAQNGQNVTVLSKVSIADGSVYSFDYNTYAQVYKIHRYAPSTANPMNFPGDYTELSSVKYDLPLDSSTGQSDCPRFSTRADKAINWNNNNEATTIFTGDLSSYGAVRTPDQVTYKELFGASGSWQSGLTLSSETWWNGDKKKWTTATWTNDNPNATYAINPKVVETNIYDDIGNRKRATMSYADYNSVSDMYEYGPDATTVYRQTHIEYLRSSAYIDNKNRRITNLVSLITTSDGSGVIYKKATFKYDLGGNYLVSQGPPFQQDSTKYGVSFVQGRGNLNEVHRWDATDPNELSKELTSTISYNTSGSVILTADELGYSTKIDYTDSFADGISRVTTLAFPTTATNPDGYSSTVQYNYDFGAITRKQNPKGAATVNTFDIIGRLDHVINDVNQAYTRYVYVPNQLSIQSFTTINNLNSEYFQQTVSDGHGRTISVSSDHPTSAGGYRTQILRYDVMGRQVSQSNPTEIDANINPVGDDATGFIFNTQVYDWKSRPTIQTNQDSTQSTISYSSCGCTGANTITVTDEVGRTQKDFYDIYGRIAQSQILNSDGSVYLTTTNTYNLLDQLLQVSVQDNVVGASQQTLSTYDGHGRLASSKTPIQISPTLYSYNSDGTLNTATDARGATKTYSYNKRKAVTSIVYGVPEGVWATPNVSFSYDEEGNRTLMVDGSGQISYQYDSLSRMTSETRTINGLSTSYTFGYEYNLSGQLTKLKEPQINTTPGEVVYSYDKAGSLSAISVNGYKWPDNYNGNNQLINNIKYRAWGGAKERLYGGNNKETSVYDARMQMSHYQVDDVTNGINTKVNGDISYHADGRVKFASDLINNADYTESTGNVVPVPRAFDRYYEYDQVGRLSQINTGTDARHMVSQGSTGTMTLDGPYNQTFKYDVFGNLTNRRGYYWSTPAKESIPNYINDRDLSKTYDSDGHILETAIVQIGDNRKKTLTKFDYDAEGQHVRTTAIEMVSYWKDGKEYFYTFPTPIRDTLDGDGVQVKRTNEKLGSFTYSIPSSVIGRTIIQINPDPQESNVEGTEIIRTVFFPNGKILATQSETKGGHLGDRSYAIGLKFRHPITGTEYSASIGGNLFRGTELDALGDSVEFVDPNKHQPPAPPTEGTPNRTYQGNPMVFDEGGFGGGCKIDGMPTSCSNLARLINIGAVQVEEFYNDGGTIRKRTYDINNVGVGIITASKTYTLDGEVTVSDEGEIVDENGNPTGETEKMGNVAKTSGSSGDNLTQTAIIAIMSAGEPLSLAVYEKSGFGRATNHVRRIVENKCTLEVSIRPPFGPKVTGSISSRAIGVKSDITTAIVTYSPVQIFSSKIPNNVNPYLGIYNGDYKGHVVAGALGGQAVSMNLFSQDPFSNNSPYKSMEMYIRKQLTAHKNWAAHVKIELFYPKSKCKNPFSWDNFRAESIGFGVEFKRGNKTMESDYTKFSN